MNDTQDNITFLTALAGDDFRAWQDRCLWVTSFACDPGNADSRNWKGWALNGKGDIPRLDMNNYFSIGIFRAADSARRRESQLGVLAIVLDDVGADDLCTLPLAPSYILETSPRNHQVGYAVPTSSDLDIAKRLYAGLIAHGLAKVDGSGNNVVRYVRLPEGRNTKGRVVDQLGAPFACHLAELHPERRYTVFQIADAFAIDLTTPAPTVGGPGDATDDELREQIRTGENFHDPFVRLAARLAGRGMPATEIALTLIGLLDEARATIPHDRVQRLEQERREIPRYAKEAAIKYQDPRQAPRMPEPPEFVTEQIPDADPAHAERAGADREHAPHAEDGRTQEGSETSAGAVPADILRQISAPPFDYEDVPEALAQFARAWSEATGFDRSGIIVAGTVAAAAAIDDRYRLTVRAKSNWRESARLWGVLLAPPSGGKSPTLRAASDPIKAIHSSLFHDWKRQCEGVKEDERPPKPALYTSDATVEALSDTLRDNPRGVLMLTEEFASWIGSLDAYRNGAGSRDRGEWLQLYDGGPHQIDRVKRGSFLVPNWGASLLAAGTPDGLRRFVKDLPEDGLIHRFIPCVMGTPGADGNGNAMEALKAWNARVLWIFDQSTCDETHIKARFAFDAQQLFDAEAAELRQVVAALADAAPSLAAHLGKHAGMLARVCLTFHWIAGRPSEAIEVGTVRLAIRFMRKVRRHANAMFSGILGAAPAFDLARALARAIVADTDRPVTIGRFYMSQHCKAFKVAENGARRAAIDLLEDAGWLRPLTDSRTYAGWPGAWDVDARVFDLYAAEGAKHRERRAAVRDAFEVGR